MPKVTLNDKAARRAEPEAGQVELWDKLLPGFGLRIAAGGARTYFVMKRIDGKLARRTVGKAPPRDTSRDTTLPEGVFWPHEARDKARRLLADMSIGIDPKPAVLAPVVAEAEPDTFKTVADRYLASTLKGGGAKLRTKGELERKLGADLKAWHDKPIGVIRRRDIQALVDAKAETSPIAANRLLSFVKRVFKWAVQKDILDADPAASVVKPSDENTRDRYLDDHEIRLFWRACDAMDTNEKGEATGTIGRLFKLALVTAQRRGEVAGLRRSELGKLQYKVPGPKGKEIAVSGDAWLLPAARTKRNVDHTVPLSPLAKTLIDGAPELKNADDEPFDCVLASGVKGDQPVSGWSTYKARLDELIGRAMAKERGEEYDAKVHVLPAWHIHDLRATAATIMESRLGVQTKVISRVLNHAEGDGRSMTARYTRHSWDKEAAEALSLWADELGRIVGLNVVSLAGERAS